MNIPITGIKRWLILFNVALSVFMATLDGSIVNIALPVISNKLSVNINSIQWVVTSYLLTISILLLIWGKISDLYGKKGIFAAGFIIFAIGSALCGTSHHLGTLVFSRILQAVGASSMMALSQGIIIETFPPGERGTALGITGTAVAVGSLAGPGLGGIMVHAFGWESIFFINIPIGILGALLTFVLIPQSDKKADTAGFDYKGSVMFAVSIVLLFTGLLLFQEGNIHVGVFAPMFTISLILLYFFIKYEKKATDPLIDLDLFKNRIFSLGIASGFLSFVAIYSSILFLPFYLQSVLKHDTLSAGLLMSFYPLAAAIIAPASGWLSDKITYRPLTATGLFIGTASLIGLSALGAKSSSLKFAVLMAFLGTGLALFQSPNNSSIMGSVPRNKLGTAGGINALFRNLGMVWGITISVILFTLVTKTNFNNVSGSAGSLDSALFLKGFRVVLISASLACFAAFIISLSRSLNRKSV